MGPIPKWDEDEAADFLPRVPTASPEELEAMARSWNWDGGISGLVAIIRSPQCDLGTALRIYWLADPEYHLTEPLPAKRENVDPKNGDVFELLLEIERRVDEGFYKKAESDFDPCARIYSKGRSRSYVNRHIVNEHAFVRELPGWAYQAVDPNAPQRPPGRPRPTLEERLEAVDRAVRSEMRRLQMKERMSAFTAKLDGFSAPKLAAKPPLGREEAIREVHRADLGDAAGRACELLRPGICLIPGGNAQTNRSRFGGPALLPPGTPWPTVDRRDHFAACIDIEQKALKQKASFPSSATESGRKFLAQYQRLYNIPAVPLTLLAVIQLRELDPAFTGLDLPREGVLNFFYDRHTNPRGFDPAQRDGWHVIYASKGAVPTQSPPDCEVTQSIGVSFRSIWSLPPARVIWPDGSGLGHIQDYAKLSLALRGNVPGAMGCHRIGGWPDEVYGEMRVVCALASNGVNCIGAIDSSDQRVQKLWRSDPDEWRLLFQLNPYDVPFNETSWAYVDTGRPFFWIACADLAARRFDKVWCLSP